MGSAYLSFFDGAISLAPETLFRSNTPFTRLLDATMRLYAHDFLQTALGPCVRDIVDMGLELETHPARESNSSDDVAILAELVSRLWSDIYMTRERFPP
jgi:hypothetical protein